MLYNDKPEIDLEALNHIHLALITSAKSIYINKNIKINKNLPKNILEHIEDNLNFFKEKKLIKLWTYPFDIPSQSTQYLEVLPEKDYFLWNEIIQETFLKGKNLVSLFEIINNPTKEKKCTKLEERTSKIILIRKEYWVFAVASSFRLDYILNSYGSPLPPKKVNTDIYNYSTLMEPLIRKLFQVFRIPELSSLTGKDVYKLHLKNKDFRKIMESVIYKRSNFKKRDIIQDAFNKIVTEMADVLSNILSENSTSSFLNATLSALSIHFPAISFINVANDVTKEFDRRSKYGFIYFLSRIKKLTGRKK